MKRLIDKVAIITGGGGGIGAAVAKRMVDEGAYVVVADVREDSALRAAEPLGDKALAVRFDAGDPASIKELVDRTVAHFGRIDILHNNAALTGFDIIPLDTNAIDTPLEIWNKTLQVNTTGYMLGCKYALPHMIAGGGGSIINTASGAGIAGDVVRLAYGSSKAAVISLTQYVATQHGHQNIRCNAIAPGVVLTEGILSAPGIADIVQPNVLTTRLGVPEDIAALAAFLASDESGYITGQTICVDGGLLSHLPHYAQVSAQMRAQ